MAKSFKKSLNTFSKMAGILVAIVTILAFINGPSSLSGGNYENSSGIFIEDNSGNINITGDIYNYERELKVEVKNTFNKIVYNIIEEQETFGSETDGTDEYIEPLNEENEVDDVNDESYMINSIGIEFIKIPAGEFFMGSYASEKDRQNDEGPVHEVTIEAFELGKYEVTQKQWFEVMDSNPSTYVGDDLPVGHVSKNDVEEFIRKLNEREGTDKYRLPSEAEWEYACRAGTITRYSFGDDESELNEYAWYNTNSGNQPHQVGQKMPNPWGLYDMHGNVWEWVQDSSHESYDGAPSDGSAWGSGGTSRGGSYYNYANFCRSANRNYKDPMDGTIGFRLLREL